MYTTKGVDNRHTRQRLQKFSGTSSDKAPLAQRTTTKGAIKLGTIFVAILTVWCFLLAPALIDLTKQQQQQLNDETILLAKSGLMRHRRRRIGNDAHTTMHTQNKSYIMPTSRLGNDSHNGSGGSGGSSGSSGSGVGSVGSVGSGSGDRIKTVSSHKHPLNKHGSVVSIMLSNGTTVTIPSSAKFYVEQRSDRTGAAITDYLNAHAFVFRLNHQYLGTAGKQQQQQQQESSSSAVATFAFGGACGKTQRREPFKTRHATQKQLLDDLGLLTTEIPMNSTCPKTSATSKASERHKKEERDSDSDSDSDDRTDILLTSRYYFEWDGRKPGFGAFTSEWTNYMRRHIAEAFRHHSSNDHDRDKEQKNTTTTTTTIVVHIRRGDVEPCDLYTRNRYLTNQYYIDMIQECIIALPKNDDDRDDDRDDEGKYKIIVHSQNRSFEPWSEFESKLSSSMAPSNHQPHKNNNHNNRHNNIAIEMKLDVPIKEVWYDILFNADVFIMSKSSFSFAAAVLMDVDTTTAVYFPSGFHLSRRWINVNETKIRTEQIRLESTIENQCHSNNTFDVRELDKTERFKRMGETFG